MPDSVRDQSRGRRSFLARSAAAIAAVFAGRAASAEEVPSNPKLQTEGDVLKTSVYQGRPPLEPLDTMIRFERSDDNNGQPITHEILSLMHEEKGANSYPWTIYSHLTTSHVTGDACVMCSRLTKKGAGWSCGLHSEVFNHARAVALGMNIEMTNLYDKPEECNVIGLNVQMLKGQPMQMGIQVHGEGEVGKAVALNGTGDTGLDLGGQYETGINARGNTIRVDEGTCIELDGKGKVRLRYKAGRIEFLNGDRCIGHIDVDAEDHAI